VEGNWQVLNRTNECAKGKVSFGDVVFIFSDVYGEMDHILNRTDHKPPKKRAPIPEPASCGLAPLTIATVP
jgi:hypothetical protein